MWRYLSCSSTQQAHRGETHSSGGHCCQRRCGQRMEPRDFWHAAALQYARPPPMKTAPVIGAQHAAHGAPHGSAAGLDLLGAGEAPVCGMAMKKAGPAPKLPCDQSEGGVGEALIEADGEALSEASRVGTSESAHSSASRVGIVQAGVESTPPSEYRK